MTIKETLNDKLLESVSPKSLDVEIDQLSDEYDEISKKYDAQKLSLKNFSDKILALQKITLRNIGLKKNGIKNKIDQSKAIKESLNRLNEIKCLLINTENPDISLEFKRAYLAEALGHIRRIEDRIIILRDFMTGGFDNLYLTHIDNITIKIEKYIEQKAIKLKLGEIKPL